VPSGTAETPDRRSAPSLDQPHSKPEAVHSNFDAI
jgi:hypothetical protein